MASGYSAKRFEENRGNRKLCHLNPFEFFDQEDPCPFALPGLMLKIRFMQP